MENIRTYTFNVPGFIPGVPGDWPGGSWATINEDTKQVLDWGPKPAEQGASTPDLPPALQQEPVIQQGG